MSAVLADTTPTQGLPQATRRRRGGGILTAVRHNPKALVGLVIFAFFGVLAIVPQWFTSAPQPDPLALTTGQDALAQIIYGTRQTMEIALIAGLFATVLSVLVGVSAAYLGGVTDDVLSLITDVFLVIPSFPLIIVLASYAGSSVTVIIVVLVITGWSYGARQLRAQGLSLRNRDFLESARVRGERRSYIILFEILPTMTSLIVANFLGAALYAVLTAAGLQFLGLGNSNEVSWGTILYHAQQQSGLETHRLFWELAPGLCVALLGAAFALLNNAFDEISNPALRPVRRPRVKRAHS